MSNFLEVISEATPETASPQVSSDVTGQGQLASKPQSAVKKGGFLGKVTSAAQKSANFIQKGAKVARGQWDVNNFLQGILNKQLDMGTNKLGSFGKPNFNRVKLGSDVIRKINLYGQNVEVDPTPVEANESYNCVFLSKIDEAMSVLNHDKEGKFKSINKTSKATQVWDVLKDVLELDTGMKVKDPDTGKSVLDRRITWISKGIPSFLKIIKEFYPGIPFTYKAHSKEESLSAVNVKSEQEEEFNFSNTTKQDWVKTLGAEKAEKIVRGLAKIYPGDRIKFDEKDGEGPVAELTVENAIFELTGRTSFGEKGIQYTLKPINQEIKDILMDREIKYLTYLLQSRDNEFKAPETNKGIIYAYDESNEPINEITSSGVNFQWNGQEKLYMLSSNNKELLGVKYSEGQYPINKADVKPLTDGKHILMRPDEKSGYMKFQILQDLPTTEQFLINFKKGVAATPEEIKEAEAVADTSPIQKTR